MINLKPIPGYEGYSIDSFSGLIFSHKSQKFLQTKPNNIGYARTEVYNKGKRKHLFNHIKNVEVHGDCNGRKIPKRSRGSLRRLGLSIDHLNRDKMNPRIDNLELVKHSENVNRYYAKKDLGADFPIPDLI